MKSETHKRASCSVLTLFQIGAAQGRVDFKGVPIYSGSYQKARDFFHRESTPHRAKVVNWKRDGLRLVMTGTR